MKQPFAEVASAPPLVYTRYEHNEGTKTSGLGRRYALDVDHYPHFEQILYSISSVAAPAPRREAVMRQRNTGIEQRFVWARKDEAVKGSNALPGHLFAATNLTFLIAYTGQDRARVDWANGAIDARQRLKLS